MTTLQFSELGLAEPINRALANKNYTHPTPIQAKAIPLLLDGKDMLGIAQTGTGKTAAFTLPLLHHLSHLPKPSGKRTPRMLVLAPTRELVTQISDAIRTYGKYLQLYQTVIFGGVPQKKQVQALMRGVDIIIATPGRLLDLVKQRHLKLDTIQYFVMDEADRMLDMGFIGDIRKIANALPKERQSLLFSATMAKEIEQLAREFLSTPARIEVKPQATPIEKISQSVYHVESRAKTELLKTILNDEALSRVIVFARTKSKANRVTELLSKSGVVTEAIHGNKSQNARQKALKRFRSGNSRVLVATDVVARGIDISNVTHVINYELPNEAESYVHRIGRTARAGAEGIAISFCDASERGYLRDIERLIQQRLEVIGDEPAYEPKQAANQQPQRRRSQKKPWQKKGRPFGKQADSKSEPRSKAKGETKSRAKFGSKFGPKAGERKGPQSSSRPPQNKRRKRAA